MTGAELNEEMRRGLALWWERRANKGQTTMSNTAGCTNTDKRHFPLRIERMPDGGFVVSDTPFLGVGENSRFCVPLFASSSIGEALAFMCSRLDPETHKAWQEQQAKAADALRADQAKAAHDAKVAEVPADLRAEKVRQEREASRAFAKPREASAIRLCGICKSSRMGRYCPRPNCTERGLGA